jgi:hypothetical protein
MEKRLHNVEKGLILTHGKKIPTPERGIFHKVLHAYGKYLGATVGDKIGGPIGAVVGIMVGDHLSNAVDKKYGRNILETPAMRKTMKTLKEKAPAVHERILKEYKRYGVKIEKEIEQKAKQIAKDKFQGKNAPKGLPAPKKGSPKSSNNVPIIPSHTTIEKRAQKINSEKQKEPEKPLGLPAGKSGAIPGATIQLPKSGTYKEKKLKERSKYV